MTQDELKLVLEALKWCHGGEPCGTAEAIAVVEKALAQPAQEPVCPECKAGVLYECVACSSNNYPPQRTWVGLTEEEIGDEYVRFDVAKGGFNRFEYAVRAIESKLKELNT